MEPVEALALVSGRVDEELLLRNEYLAAENEILKSKFSKPLQLNNCERIRLAKIGKRIGLKVLREIACIVRPETILEWFRRLVAKKFDGTKNRKKAGRPRIDHELEALVIEQFKRISFILRCQIGLAETLDHRLDSTQFLDFLFLRSHDLRRFEVWLDIVNALIIFYHTQMDQTRTRTPFPLTNQPPILII